MNFFYSVFRLPLLARGSVVVIVACAAVTAQAQQFLELVQRVPHASNAVVILNVEKAKSSPAGLSGGLAAKMEKAFQDGLICVPPGATRFVLASQIDLEFMSPVWEAAVMELADVPSMDLIAKAYRGETDVVEKLPAVILPNDAYVIKLGPKTVGAMSPANRQAVVRWVREFQSSNPPKPSAYLERAAGYSDRAGTEIIMALDLDGLLATRQVQNYLQPLAWLDEAKVDRAKLIELLMSIEGVRLGVRLGEPPNGRITADFKQDAKLPTAAAKRLFLEYLAAKGLMIEDLNEWQSEVQGKTISIYGSLTRPGLRKMLSVIESPAPSGGAAERAVESPGTSAASTLAAQAAKTKTYFTSVSGMFDDLKDDMKDAKNLASTSLFFDKYARRIERLPMLDVDPEMLDYGAFVGEQMRQAAGAVRMMGIRTGVRTAEINSSNTGAGSDYYYGGYGYGRYGNGGITGMKGDLQAVEQQRGVVRAQERGSTAASVQEIKAGVIAATSDVRRKMTEKYKVQF